MVKIAIRKVIGKITKKNRLVKIAKSEVFGKNW